MKALAIALRIPQTVMLRGQSGQLAALWSVLVGLALSLATSFLESFPALPLGSTWQLPADRVEAWLPAPGKPPPALEIAG